MPYLATAARQIATRQDSALTSAYRFHRLAGRPTMEALQRAALDRIAGTRRYPSTGLGSYQNSPNGRGGRWIESPASAGLRFVGFSDRIAGRGRGIDHCGWYLDREFMEESARGAVYQLPARKGRPQYVEATREGAEGKNGWQDRCGSSSAPAVVYLGARHEGDRGGIGESISATSRYLGDYAESAMRDAARGADRDAEITAEAENEYQEGWRAGNRWREAGEEIAESRREALALLAEMRPLRRAGGAAPAICSTLRAAVASLVWEIHRAREKRAELAAGYWNRDAFNDAAGAVVLA